VLQQTTNPKGLGAADATQRPPTNHGLNDNLKRTYSKVSASISTVEQALSFIPADDRDTWIKCGMAIKAEFGDSGFDLWDTWSGTAENYRARDAAASWRSFNSSGGVGIGTLFHIAKQYGYQCDSNNKPRPPTPEQVAKREAKLKAEADLLVSRREAAASKAVSIWNAPENVLEEMQPTIADHPYLKRKGIQAYGAKIYHGNLSIGGMSCNNALMIPMRLNGETSSLQFIAADGSKRFLPSGEKGGYLIGKITSGVPICIAEGFATGASIHEATGYAVIVAFDAGNLHKLAEALRARNPDARIVLCADDDETGTGQRKATEAAQAVGGLLAMPVFGEQRLGGVKDFNDMAKLKGLDAVKLVIDAAKPVEQKIGTVGLRVVDLNRGGNTNTQSAPPEPLPTLPDVLPFNYACLPDVLRGYVKDISERMQCPPDFAAVGALVMMAAIIGRKVGIRPKRKDDWIVIPNLWGAVVGNSGIKKTPALNQSLTPINKLQMAAFELCEKEKYEYDAEAEIAKMQQSVKKMKARASLKKDQSADVKELLQSSKADGAPICKRYITNNATYEKLGEILTENPNGVMVEYDEIIGLLKQLDATGQEVARSFYLSGANGDTPCTFDRIMRGTLHIPAVCLSIIGGIQPGVLAEYVRHATNGGAGADGLLQRFGLMVYPDISPECHYVDRYPDSTAREAVNMLTERLDSLNPADIGAEVDRYGSVPFLSFDDVAQELYSRWTVELDKRLRSGEEHPAIVSHLSKYQKLVPSLALIFHLCDTPKGAVSETALLRAIAFSEYLESHAQRIYSYATRPDVDAAKTLLKRLASGKLSNQFKARDIYQKGWAGLETANKAQAAIDLLLEYHHLSEEEITTGGRPTTHYHWIKAEAL